MTDVSTAQQEKKAAREIVAEHAGDDWNPVRASALVNALDHAGLLATSERLLEHGPGWEKHNRLAERCMELEREVAWAKQERDEALARAAGLSRPTTPGPSAHYVLHTGESGTLPKHQEASPGDTLGEGPKRRAAALARAVQALDGEAMNLEELIRAAKYILSAQ